MNHQQYKSLPNPVLVLPPEVYGKICEDPYLESRDLHNLSAVSWTLNAEANRLLYSDMKLQEKEKILAFCTAVINRPVLVERLRKLVLVMPPQMCLSPEEFSLIKQTLLLSASLLDLRMLSRSETFAGNAMMAGVLEGHAFKLNTFVNTYFHSRYLIKFLESQPSLETLVTDRLTGDLVWSTPFPNLKNLSCTHAFQSSLGFRPMAPKGIIERLQINIHGNDSFDCILWHIQNRFGETLQYLSIVVMRLENVSETRIATEIVEAVATHLPHVKWLEIMGHSTPTPHNRDPLPRLSAKTHLKTLILHPPKLIDLGYHVSEAEFTDNHWTYKSTEQERLSLASEIMEAIPTLEQLILPNYGDCFGYFRAPGSEFTGEEDIHSSSHFIPDSLSAVNNSEKAAWLHWGKTSKR